MAEPVEAFLARGGSVCPFAARANRVYAAAGLEPRKDRVALLEGATRFMFTKGKTPNGSLLCTGTPEGFDATKLWAREVFLELMTCFSLFLGASQTELEEAMVGVRVMLFDETNLRRPVLGCGTQPLFAICMSPVYPKTHPRYAPETVVVVTWQSDVTAAQGQKAKVARIREAMKREHGFVYDADDLMLPLPERAP